VYLPKNSSRLNQIEVVFGVIMRKVIRRGRVHLGVRFAHEIVELYRVFQSSVRQAVRLDVDGSSTDESSGVKLGKIAKQGMDLASLVFNYEKLV